MDRVTEMEAFLKTIKTMLLENPGINFNSRTYYTMLMNYGVENSDYMDPSIREKFFDWGKYFDNAENLKVYVSANQNRFLQFRNANYFNSKCHKLYVTYSKNNMDEAVKRIFDFIDKNNFTTYSKVSDVVRSDSIVLRLPNTEDAKKVIDFINNDPFLSSSANKTNPFLVRDGVVGMGYDDMLSYNSSLSQVLEGYFTNKINTDTLKEAGLNDLKNYMDNELMDIISNPNQDFYNKKFNENSDRFKNKESLIKNSIEVIKLMRMNLNEQMTKKDVLDFVDECNGKNKQLEQEGSYVCTDTIDLTKETVNEFIRYAYQKYEDMNLVANAIKRFALTGQANVITRDNNLRDKFVTFVNREKLMEMVNGDYYGYCDALAGNDAVFVDNYEFNSMHM